MMIKNLVIVIDGPAGAGKSTVGKLLAQRLGYHYLDTGALYRAVAYTVGKAGIREDEEGKLREFLAATDIRWEKSPEGMRVRINGEDVTRHLRTEEVGLKASELSALPLIRKMLLPVQRAAGRGGGIVADGRDMASVVFPDAEVKFFLDAAEAERIKRRQLELATRNPDIEYANVAEDLRKRDRQDRTRAIAPLRPSDKATIIDTTGMTIDEVVEAMIYKTNRYLSRELT